MGGAIQPAPGYPGLTALDARPAAHRILTGVRQGAFADHAAERVLAEVEPSERGLALQIAYGTLRLRARLDTWIQSQTDRPLRRIDADVADWLRIGTYQLKELRVPDHAAVGETVRWARRAMDPGRAGYINAVLRTIAAETDADPFPSRDTDPVAYMTTWGSHPEWLVRRWLDRWSLHDVARLVKHDNVPPGVTVRMLDGREPQVSDEVELRPLPGWPGSYELVRGSPAAALAGNHAVIQDPAASAVVDYVGADVAGPVYDACAAPGTKAAGLAAAAGLPVVSADTSRDRLRRAANTGSRLGLPILCAVADARRPPIGAAGTLLADVPCTGTGVLRRRPDARWRIEAPDLAQLAALQAEILDACAGAVREGGLLVYSTCSLEPEENEEQVDAFLARHPHFAREAPTEDAVPDGCVTERGDLFVRPWLTGTDGAYAARLRRSA